MISTSTQIQHRQRIERQRQHTLALYSTMVQSQSLLESYTAAIETFYGGKPCRRACPTTPVTTSAPTRCLRPSKLRGNMHTRTAILLVLDFFIDLVLKDEKGRDRRRCILRRKTKTSSVHHTMCTYAERARFAPETLLYVVVCVWCACVCARACSMVPFPELGILATLIANESHHRNKKSIEHPRKRGSPQKNKRYPKRNSAGQDETNQISSHIHSLPRFLLFFLRLLQTRNVHNLTA